MGVPVFLRRRRAVLSKLAKIVPCVALFFILTTRLHGTEVKVKDSVQVIGKDSVQVLPNDKNAGVLKVNEESGSDLKKDDAGAGKIEKMKAEKEEVKEETKEKEVDILGDYHKVESISGPDAPGEQGAGIKIDKEKLSVEERAKFDEGWKRNAYNQYASDMMSLHRSLPDVRPLDCKKVTYPTDDLPDTDVIICFHNEAWSGLLRTIHSVIERTPKHLLRHVILVDDFSSMDHLKKPLDDYVEKFGNVKIVRTTRREGLIRARLIGYAEGTAETATFLDSHCECADGWSEPLLSRVHEDYRNVACPMIDVIKDDTLEFAFTRVHNHIGGFDWNLGFNWYALPDYEKKRLVNDTMPFRTPTMPGGLFTISRKWFDKLGKYDPGFDIWGGENLEISFKVWMCGGLLEFVPCSHVGHIFRTRSPYKWGSTGGNVMKKNSVRLAEVWLDDYKDIFYARFNHNLGDYGDVSDRKALRKSLQCHSFNWYIKTVYPFIFLPTEGTAVGEIRNKVLKMCFDGITGQFGAKKKVIMYGCHGQGTNQRWILSKGNEIRRDDTCMDYGGKGPIILDMCHGLGGNQVWEYREDNRLYHKNHHRCAEMSTDGKNLTMEVCSDTERQVWLWERQTPYLP